MNKKNTVLLLLLVVFFVGVTMIYVNYYSSDDVRISARQTDEDYCSDWCDVEELYSIGCDKRILAHLAKYSNLLDEDYDGNYFINEIGLPDGISKEKFQECVDFIIEKRLPSSQDYFFSRINMTNACTSEPSICYGTFSNNTSVRVKCDFPIHGCGPIHFGSSPVFPVIKDGISFDVNFSIKGGAVKEITFSNTTNSLLVIIDSSMQGNLTLNIPRDLLDAKMDYCPPRMTNPLDDGFFVLRDGEEIEYDEIQTTDTYRTLHIQFLDNSTKIEVIGTCLI